MGKIINSKKVDEISEKMVIAIFFIFVGMIISLTLQRAIGETYGDGLESGNLSCYNQTQEAYQQGLKDGVKNTQDFLFETLRNQDSVQICNSYSAWADCFTASNYTGGGIVFVKPHINKLILYGYGENLTK